MRNRKAFLYLAVVASAGWLAAAPAMAADPVPALSCSAGSWTISTAGLDYVSCPAGTCTQVMYSVSGTGTPDHLATFVRAEAGPVTASGSFTQTAPCDGDAVIGVGSNAVCHERIVRFNNQSTKASAFSLSVDGRRKPIATSVVVKKGSSQAACRIVGFGLEDSAGGDACVSSCGSFNVNQTVTTAEIFKFKGCEVKFTFNLMTGQVTNFSLVADTTPGGSCTINGATGGPVTDLFVSGGPLGGTDTDVTFGDGWISSGENSCSTRFVGGRYYSVCQ